MIVKQRDPKDAEITHLEALLAMQLSDSQRFLVARELRFLRSGEKGEKDSAYFIDFHFGHSKNWAVIHDLRLVYQGQVAQIDHIVINRFFDMYILETKNYAYGVKITPEGEFLVYDGKRYFAMESPIEQNERHMRLLQEVIEGYHIMPTRLGIPIVPRFRSYILVSPTSRIIRPSRARFDTDMVIKSDQAFERIMKEADNVSVLSAMAKVSFSDTLVAVGSSLAKLHRPLVPNYEERFGIKGHKKPIAYGAPLSERQPAATVSDASFSCEKCGKGIPLRVVQYCWDNKHFFGGRTYCYDCQRNLQGK